MFRKLAPTDYIRQSVTVLSNLLETEEYIRHMAAIVDSSDDAIISKTLSGVIKSWNKGGERMFGFTAAEAIGQNISIIVPTEYLKEEKSILDNIFNNGKIDHYETVRNRKNGERFFVSITVSPLKDSAGKIIGVSKIARDITARKKAEAEIIRFNKHLALQNIEKEKRAEELSVANKELHFQNQEREKRAVELILANRELIFQNEEKEKRAAELIIANEQLIIQNQENEKRAAELIIANAELAFQNIEKEKMAAELITANLELIKAEEQFRMVVESAPYAMVLIDQDGLISLVNNQTEKLFGYNRNDLIGNKLEMLLPERYHHQPLDPWSSSMIADPNLVALRKNGLEVQIVEIGLTPIETAKGQIVLVSIIDVTERKMQEEAMKKHNKELEQFAYVASHDLQEPLRTVSNYMEVFEEDYLPLLDEKALHYLHSVNKATTRMSTLIKSLLAFSRLGHNKVLVYVDCNTLINDVIADLAIMIKKSGAMIHVKKMPFMHLYDTEIRQLFQNLISNAIKFRNVNTQPEIHISAEETGKNWEFKVSDNGIGIDVQSFDRVFDIFQRLHTGDKYEGSGIGLANCKKIVQLHQGKIWIESILGQGTTFVFTIANL